MDFLSQIYGSGDVNVYVLLIDVPLALLLSMVVCYVYRITFTGITYSQTFLLSLIMITIVTAVLISVIGGNLARAFSLVGALSIIRYRTAVKDARDTGFIFLCVATGMILGAGYYALAVGLILIMSVIMIVLHKFNFASDMVHRSVVSVTIEGSQVEKSESVIRAILQKSFREVALLEHYVEKPLDHAHLKFVVSSFGRGFNKTKQRERERVVIEDVQKVSGVLRVALETDQVQHNI